MYTSWFAIGICGVALGVWTMIRYGLITLIMALFVDFVLNTYPITFDPKLWYADQTLFALVLVAAIAAYGALTAEVHNLSGIRPRP